MPPRRSISAQFAQFLVTRDPALPTTSDPFLRYRFRVLDYIRECLGARVWSGQTNCLCRGGTTPHDHPGLQEVLLTFDKIMQQQHEETWTKLIATVDDVEAARLRKELDSLPTKLWTPGDLVKQELQVPGGHSIGKSYCIAMVANYFFDVFTPCVVSIIAPKAEQAKEQLLQDIKDIRRRGKNLPGVIMDRIIRGPKMLDTTSEESSKHFIRIATASMEGGKAGERLQGMHAPYQLIIMDESEGIHETFLAPIQSWLAGGMGIICELANPKTRTSWFHKRRDDPLVQRMTVSAVYHPNVLNDSNEYPGAVGRKYVESLLSDCKRVTAHDPSRGTIELPWRPGEIYEPGEAFSFRVLGEAPATFSPRCFVTPAAFDAARERGTLLIRAEEIDKMSA